MRKEELEAALAAEDAVMDEGILKARGRGGGWPG